MIKWVFISLLIFRDGTFRLKKYSVWVFNDVPIRVFHVLVFDSEVGSHHQECEQFNSK